MTTQEIIDELLELQKANPYGDSQVFQVGYLRELIAWITTFNPAAKDDLMGMLETKRQQKEGK